MGALVGAAAAIPVFGAPIVGGLMAAQGVWGTLSEVEGAATTRRALAPGLNNLRGFGAQYGYRPAESEGLLGAIAGSGLGADVLNAGLSRRAMLLNRALNLDVGQTADFYSLFRAGGGAEFAVSGTPAQRAAGIQSRLMGGIADARSAGLNAADVPRYLAIIAQRTTQLAEAGYGSDTKQATRMASLFRELTGARGTRGLTGAMGIADAGREVGFGGSDPMTEYFALQVAMEHTGNDLFAAKKWLRDPANAEAIVAGMAKQYRMAAAKPGAAAAMQDIVVGDQRRMEDGEFETMLRGGATAGPAGDLPLDAAGMAKRAQGATSRPAALQAREENQDLLIAQEENLVGLMSDLMKLTRGARRAAVSGVLSAANWIMEEIKDDQKGFKKVTPEQRKQIKEAAERAAKEKAERDKSSGSPKPSPKDGTGMLLRIELAPGVDKLLRVLGEPTVFG